jgi:hypothetical protein
MEEVNQAALQFVRKISGFHKPSKTNQAAFERAVLEVADTSRRLLQSIGETPRDNNESAVPFAVKNRP